MTTKSILLLSLMLICLAGSLSGAQAGPDPAPLAALDLGNPEQFRRELTLRFVAQLRDPALRELLASRLDAGQTRISLKHLVRDWAELWPSPDRQRFAALVAGLDLDLRSEMGIQRNTRDILDLEVVWPEGGPRPMAWDGALFAVRPLAADTFEKGLSDALKDPATAAAAWTSVGRLRLVAGQKDMICPQRIVCREGESQRPVNRGEFLDG